MEQNQNLNAAASFAATLIDNFMAIDETKQAGEVVWMKPQKLLPQNVISDKLYTGQNRSSLMFTASKRNELPLFISPSAARVLKLDYSKAKFIGIVTYNTVHLFGDSFVSARENYDVWTHNGTIRMSGKDLLANWDNFSKEELRMNFMKAMPCARHTITIPIEETNFFEKYALYKEDLMKYLYSDQSFETLVSANVSKVDNVISTNSWVCPITIVPNSKAEYNAQRNEITIAPKSAYMNELNWYNDLFRCMALSTGIESLQDRKLCGQIADENYPQEILTAVFAVSVCNNYLGIESTIDLQRLAQIKNWIAAIDPQSDKGCKIICKAAINGSKAADFIINKLGLALNKEVSILKKVGLSDDEINKITQLRNQATDKPVFQRKKYKTPKK